jgi:uncharacterized delta-60 repeat protein
MWLFSSRKTRSTAPIRPRCRSYRPRLEALESRDCPSGGLLDTTFNGTGMQTVAGLSTGSPIGLFGGFNFGGAVSDVVQPADGKTVAVGHNSNNAILVVRLNRDGSLDTTFNGTGSVTFNAGFGAVGTAVALQPNGQIVVGGTAKSNNVPIADTEYVVARLNSNGSLDTSFGNNGVFVYDPVAPGHHSTYNGEEGVSCLALLSNGNIIAGGWGFNGRGSETAQFAALELTPSGTLVKSFGSGGRTLVNVTGLDYVHALAVVPTTGQIVLAGNASSSAAMAILTSAGALDTSFNGTGYEVYTGAGVFNGVAIQQESPTLYEIVVSGSGSNSSVVGRYFLSGAVDTAFGGAGTGFFTIGSGLTINTLALEKDGSIIVGGSQTYTATDGSQHTEMAVGHLSAGGILDTSFGPNGNGFSYAMIGQDSTVYGLAIDPNDGGILACGLGSGTGGFVRFTAP